MLSLSRELLDQVGVDPTLGAGPGRSPERAACDQAAFAALTRKLFEADQINQRRTGQPMTDDERTKAADEFFAGGGWGGGGVAQPDDGQALAWTSHGGEDAPEPAAVHGSDEQVVASTDPGDGGEAATPFNNPSFTNQDAPTPIGEDASATASDDSWKITPLDPKAALLLPTSPRDSSKAGRRLPSPEELLEDSIRAKQSPQQNTAPPLPDERLTKGAAPAGPHLTTMRNNALALMAAARAQHLSEDEVWYYLTKARVESTMGTRSRTSHVGIFQMSPQLWRTYGNGADINNITDQLAAAVRYDSFIKERFRYNVGRDPTYFEMYVMHQQGESGGRALLDAKPGELAFKRLMAANLSEADALAHIRPNIPTGSGATASQVTALQFVDWLRKEWYEDRNRVFQILNATPSTPSYKANPAGYLG